MTSRRITVTGTGVAEAAPDLLTLSVGVECRSGNVGAAYAEAGTTSSAVSAALRQHGVTNADIRTSGLNVRADLVWREGEGQKVAGYVATSSLTVRLRDVAAASSAISAAVEAGGNNVRLNGLDLGFSDEAAVRARAREAAWQDALRSAEQFAALASARLGRVVSLEEESNPGMPVPLPRIERAVSSDAFSVEPGQTSIAGRIIVVWELARP
ncbi:SIMPL domain-containing protein [Arthrobacter sp. D1-29]